MSSEFVMVQHETPEPMHVDDAEQPVSETETEAAEAAAPLQVYINEADQEDSNGLPPEAESTESGSGPEFSNFSDESEEYMTASDSDVAWEARYRCGRGADVWESIGGVDAEKDKFAGDSIPDDEVPTDAEVYDAEAEMEQQRALLAGEGSSEDADNSDPDTEDEAAAAAEAAAGTGSSSEQQLSAADAYDEAALCEIRHYQATTHALTSGTAFRQLLEDVAKDYRTGTTFTTRAVKALQAASEDYLISLLQRANTAAFTQGRTKVRVQDIRTVRRNRGEAVKQKGRAVLQYEYLDYGSVVRVKETIECEYEV
jgi:histone H3/H4